MPNQFRQSPMKNPSLVTSPESIEQLQQLYRAHSSSSDLPPYDYHSPLNLNNQKKKNFFFCFFYRKSGL